MKKYNKVIWFNDDLAKVTVESFNGKYFVKGATFNGNDWYSDSYFIEIFETIKEAIASVKSFMIKEAV